jgi:hypothetical protein
MGPLELLLIVVIIVVLLGALPVHKHSANWGWSPFGILLVIIIIALLFRIL